MKFAKTRALLTALLVILASLPAVPVVAGPPPDDIEHRIDALIAQMTLEEKLGQLQILDGEADGKYRPEHIEMIRKGLLGSTLNVRGAKRCNELQHIAVEQSRLKIPILFGFDVIHGYRTIFPISLGESASWDPAAVERGAAVAAAETAASGVRWTFAPMVDIARDPRWGRISESAGEDTYLGAALARARVLGFQGKDYSAPNKIVACAKHWVGYGATEGGRDYNTTDIPEFKLRDVYFPPFKAALDAGVGTFMTAFNDLNGVPSTANPFTLKKVLRDEWKFDGFVVSDYNSVLELVNHGLAADETDAARESLNAGLDMEMISRSYNKHGAELLHDSKITMQEIDDAVRHILRIKFRLGLFEHPYTDETKENAAIFNAQNIAAAREVAARSMVLLRNEHDVLPLNKGVKSIAVIGPLGDSKADMIGSWSGDGHADTAVTVVEGIRAKVSPQTKVTYAKGCDVRGDSTDGIAEAVRLANESDVVVLAIGESADMSGEARVRSTLDLPGRQLDLAKAIQATGKPVAVVLMNGRPMSINWVAENIPAILETWFAGSQAGNAIADVLFGDVNPGGKLPVTFPRNVGQVPIYYNHMNTGRPPNPNDPYTSKYIDVDWTPLYPFGYGLSYTQFRFSNLQLSETRIHPNGSLKVSVDVENTGKRTGDEVPQLYIRDVVGSRTRPVKELKGFERITLKEGERRHVEFMLTPQQLGFYNPDMKFVVEPGAFKVWVGSDSASGLESSFEVVQ